MVAGPWLRADLGSRSLALRLRHVAPWVPELSLMPPGPGQRLPPSSDPCWEHQVLQTGSKSLCQQKEPLSLQ